MGHVPCRGKGYAKAVRQRTREGLSLWSRDGVLWLSKPELCVQPNEGLGKGAFQEKWMLVKPQYVQSEVLCWAFTSQIYNFISITAVICLTQSWPMWCKFLLSNINRPPSPGSVLGIQRWISYSFVLPSWEGYLHILGLLPHGHKMATTAPGLTSSYQLTKQEGREQMEVFFVSGKKKILK